MTSLQGDQAEELFGRLFGLPAAGQALALDAEPDVEVAAEVRSLLAFNEPSSPLLAASISSMMRAVSDAGQLGFASVVPGTLFDRYRIQRKLGQGGMGEVFEAHRENDFQKRVAIKIVRRGLDTPFARQRFQQERQTLATLEHPHIARLLDGGELADGTPYLVLEFVDGLPIDGYCQGRSTPEILLLFLKVCLAVDYAHRNLVIHRDLKPANILVTAEGEPKLLDFGIAKLLETGAEATGTNLLALTPQYASPEQMRGEPMTTASDVYALAVVLYRLLTGRMPYEVDARSAAEVERIVCETAPQRPGLGVELDHILLMALRKEPGRRYASVPELAQDLERYQTGKVVFAMPDSLRYRVGKRLRRHWFGFAATAAVIVSLAAGVGVASYQAYLARQRFNQVRKLSNIFLFQFHDQIVDVPGTTPARAFVVKTALDYLNDLARDAGSDVELQAELAQAYERVGDAQGKPRRPNLGDRKGAEASYLHSAVLYHALVRRDAKYTADATGSFAALAFFYTNENRLKEAHAALASATALSQPLMQQNTAQALAALSGLYQISGELATYEGDVDAMVRDSRLGLQYRERWAKLQPPQAAGDTANQVALARLRLGRALNRRGDLAEAEPILLAALTSAERALALDPGNLRFRLIDSAITLSLVSEYSSTQIPSLERYADAARYGLRSIELLKPLIDADTADLPSRMNYMSATVMRARDLSLAGQSEGLARLRQALATWRDMAHGQTMTHGYEATALDVVRDAVGVLRKEGELAEASTLAAEIVTQRRKDLAETKPDDDNFWLLAADLKAQAEVAAAAGDFAQADRLFGEALHHIQPFAAVAGKQYPTAFLASSFYASLADLRRREGRCAEAAEAQASDRTAWQEMAAAIPYAAMRMKRAATPMPCHAARS